MSISAAESQIMEALWRRSPLTAEEIVAEVAAPQGWSEATTLKAAGVSIRRSSGPARSVRLSRSSPRAKSD